MRSGSAPHAGELEKRWAEIKPDDSFTFVYTSGTTGPPKGVVLTHKNIVWECDSMREVLPVDENDEQLLFLPMAHIFAKILEWATIAKGSRIAFAESIAKIKDNLGEVRPTFMCAVPRVLEKVYLGILGNRNAAPPTKQRIFDWAFTVGKQVSKYKQRHQPVPLSLTLKNRVATRLVFGKIQSVLGGRIRFLVSGGAPLSREIAEFFHAAGVLILEGYGLTETTAGSCVNRPEKYAFGSVGVPVPGLEVKIAEDGEILIRGGSVMKEYYGQARSDARGHRRRRLVPHRRHRRHRRRHRQDHRSQEGHHRQRRRQEHRAAEPRERAQGDAVHLAGDGPRRQAALPGRARHAQRGERGQVGARQRRALPQRRRSRAVGQGARARRKYIDELNAKEPSYSSIKKFAVLPHDFSQDTGELTPTLKVKRKFTSEKYKDIIDAFYTN